MINTKTTLLALAFLAMQVVSNTCPPCYTHTVTAKPPTPCPMKPCGVVCDLPIRPTKIPTITIPGPNPECPKTSTVTVPGKCTPNPCSCPELEAAQALELASTTTMPFLSCRSTGAPVTKTLPPTSPAPTPSCSKYRTVSDGLMCPMTVCVRQTRPCDLLPTLPPQPTKITMTRTRDCTVTHIVGAPCPQCPRCRLEVPAERR